ncbi:MAG: hypothetical protein ACLU9S_09490 [Oscillospiraceae bacterium]
MPEPGGATRTDEAVTVTMLGRREVAMWQSGDEDFVWLGNLRF